LSLKEEKISLDQKEQTQFRLARAATVATGGRNAVRYPWLDMETYAILKITSGMPESDWPTPESKAVLQTTLHQIDEAIREFLSDVSLKIMNLTQAKLDTAPAKCVVVNSKSKEELELIAPSGFGLVKDASESPTRNWVAVADGKRVDNSWSSEGVDGSITDGSIVCLSGDGNWLLSWYADQSGKPSSPPIIQRIIWINKQTSESEKDKKDWYAYIDINGRRGMKTAQSLSFYSELQSQYESLKSDIGNRIQNVFSFHRDNRIGFVLPVSPDNAAVLWTSTGLSDPEEVPPLQKVPDLVPCQGYKEVSVTEQQREMKCDFGEVSYDNQSHHLVIEYYTNQNQVPYPGETAPRCSKENPLCPSGIQLEFFPAADLKNLLEHVLIRDHISTRIKESAVDDGYLWLADEGHQKWRYVVSADRLMALLREHWTNTEWDKFKVVPISEPCQRLECNLRVPGWPPTPGAAR
jgi:hypothetical protein